MQEHVGTGAQVVAAHAAGTSTHWPNDIAIPIEGMLSQYVQNCAGPQGSGTQLVSLAASAPARLTSSSAHESDTVPVSPSRPASPLDPASESEGPSKPPSRADASVVVTSGVDPESPPLDVTSLPQPRSPATQVIASNVGRNEVMNLFWVPISTTAGV
jgi:hypothetical protein